METKLTLALLLLLTWAGCRGNQSAQETLAAGDTLDIRHARNLTLVQHVDHVEALIRNPWDTTRTLRRYILSEGKKPSYTPEDATLVRVPLRKAAVFNSVHCGLMQELGCTEAIGGVCEVKYIRNPHIKEGVERGRIADLGNGMSPNIERIMALQPDALLPSAFEHSGGYGRLERLGIPIVECAEYMEVSPLAQAEWMRFYGRLFGKGAVADSLFARVEAEYLNLKEKAVGAKHKPKVINELPHSGKWFTAAGQSTMGQLYRDAGADYAFAHLPGSGNVTLSIEQVLDKALHAEFWMLKHYGPATRRQLTADVPALSRIPARMWMCDTQNSNYFEETPFHPEWLLRNLITVFHPELGIEDGKAYFKLLE